MKKINRSNDALNAITRRRFIQYGSLAAASSIVAACTPTTTTPTTTGGTTASPAADGKKGIKVGVMYSTTGTIAIVEKSLQDATFLAIDQINEGTGPWAGKKGIDGQMIEKVVVNPDSNWDLYNQMSKRLIDEDKVVCVLGCYTSASRKSLVRRASSLVLTTSILKKVIGSPRLSWSMVAVKLSVMNTLHSVQLSSSPSSTRSSKLSPISSSAI